MLPPNAARIIVNFTLAVMPILISNISSKRVTINKNNMLTDNTVLNACRVDVQKL